jgi:hypothetical protein
MEAVGDVVVAVVATLVVEVCSVEAAATVIPSDPEADA